MTNTEFLNLSLPELTDKIDINVINNDFKAIEKNAEKHAIVQEITIDETAIIKGVVGPYLEIENLTEEIVEIDIADEILLLQKDDKRKIRTISVENVAVAASGLVKIKYFTNAKHYVDENYYSKEKVDELIEGVDVEVDAKLSESSENPVQNKVVTAELAQRLTQQETIALVVEKVAEIVAGAPEDFDTLKELSDWLLQHEDSAASMNSAIQKNTASITTANANIAKNVEDIETANANIAKNVDDITATKTSIAINKSTLGTQCQNLLKTSSKANITKNGLTFKVQADRSIKVTGTATSNATIDVYVAGDWQSETVLYPLDSYRIHLQHDTNTTMTITVLTYDGKTQSSVWVNNPVNGKAFTNFVTGIYITFRPTTGVTYDNHVYPMLTYADITDSTYEPYTPSLQEQINALLARIEVIEGAAVTTEGGE